MRTVLQERAEVHYYKTWVLLLVPVVALSLQAYLPLWLPSVAVVDFALLVTLYFATNRRSQIVGLLMGAGIGLVQDALSSGPLGLFSMVKTVVGYLASSMGARLDTDSPVTRVLLIFGFHWFHAGLFWILQRALLQKAAELPGLNELVAALVNALCGVVIFQLLDGLRQRE